MLKRRDILRAITAAPAVCAGARARGQGLGTDYDVVVIGAGVSGLAATRYLRSLKADLKILTLDARDRIGGRIYSQRLSASGSSAELGAPSLDGSHGDSAVWTPPEALGLNVLELPDGVRTLHPGMDALVNSLAGAASGEVQLNSSVEEIFWREGLVGISYLNRGLASSVTSRRLLITLPAAVLGSPDFRITPGLGDAKLGALAAIRTSNSICVALRFSAADAVLRNGTARWFMQDDASRLSVYRDDEGDDVLLQAQFRGARADVLEGQSERLLLAYALRQLAPAFEQAPSLESARWSTTHDWLADRHARGAQPIASGTLQHLTLAESLYNTVFFAGDATADPGLIGTLAGAYGSGVRAARELAVSLGVAPAAPDPNGPVFELL